MDVEQLFKRKAEPDEVSDVSSNKVAKTEETGSEWALLNLIQQEAPSSKDEMERFDASWLKRALKKLDEAMIENTELMNKYPDEPQRFADSEFELHNLIKSLSGISIADDSDELMEIVCKDPVTLSLISMIKRHPSLEIASQIVKVFSEFLEDDEDDEEEDQNDDQLQDEEEGTARRALSDLFAKTKFTYQLCDHVIRLDMKCNDPVTKKSVQLELADDIQTCMGLMIQLVTFKGLNKQLIDDKKLMKYIFAKMSAIKNSSQVTEFLQSISEFLSTLVSMTGDVELIRLDKFVTKFNVIETLLMNLSIFIDVKSVEDKVEQEEYIENVVDTLCYLVNVNSLAKKQYLSLEGLELMQLIANKSSKWLIEHSYKIISNAMNINSEESQQVAKEFVNKGGLKYLFKFIKQQHALKEITSILASLFRLLEVESTERIRVFNKLMDKEDHYSKKLIQIHTNVWESINEEEDEVVKIEKGLDVANNINTILVWCLIDSHFGDHFAKGITSTMREILIKQMNSRMQQLQSILPDEDNSTQEIQTYGDLFEANTRENLEMLEVISKLC